MVVGMKDPVNYNGTITTIDELDRCGLITFVKVENFSTKKGLVTKYFADIKTDNLEVRSGYEIGRLAYLSRTKQEIVIK